MVPVLHHAGAICFGDPIHPGPQDGADVLDKLGEVLGPYSSKNTVLIDTLAPLALGQICLQSEYQGFHKGVLVFRVTVYAAVGHVATLYDML